MHNHRFARLAWLALLSLAAGVPGCSDAPLISPDPYPDAFAVDSASYTAEPIGNGMVAFRVVASYRNPTNAPVYLERCFPTSPHPMFTVDLQSSSSTAQSAYNASFACVGHDSPIVVNAGDTRVDTLSIPGPNAYNNGTGQFLGALEGTFSIGYFASSCVPSAAACNPGGVPARTAEFVVKLSAAGVIPAMTRDLGPAIQTDSVLYHVRTVSGAYRSQFRLTLYNSTADTIYIASCTGAPFASLEKKLGDSWSTVWTALPPSCPASAPIVVAPNAHLEWTTSLEAATPASANALPRFMDSEIGGTYRLSFTAMVNHYAGTPGSGVPLPVELRRTNAFVLVREF